MKRERAPSFPHPGSERKTASREDPLRLRDYRVSKPAVAQPERPLHATSGEVNARCVARRRSRSPPLHRLARNAALNIWKRTPRDRISTPLITRVSPSGRAPERARKQARRLRSTGSKFVTFFPRTRRGRRSGMRWDGCSSEIPQFPKETTLFDDFPLYFTGLLRIIITF